MYDPGSTRAEEFIAHEEIEETLAYARRLKNDQAALRDILAKAGERKGLTHREASVLLAGDDP
ncbi:MAG: [FeFe] hydrogenase H-cluster radical SAM maturase HydG, partial [Treponema sp.]|nr:[FeFe] hydrogenase H-cluster radical SAM maturase HydG [Treponema sp.]